MTELFPEYIDNTLLKDWRRCPQAFWRKRVQGLRTKQDGSVDLVFGGAFAAGMEAMRKAFYEDGKSEQDALLVGRSIALEKWGESNVVVPTRSNKTQTNLLDMLEYYANAFPLGADPLKPVRGGIEHTFEVPLNIGHPVTGKTLIFVGRMDLRAEDMFGCHVAVDEKTTSQFSDSWLAQWDMDTQMTGYIWAMQQQGVEARAEVRGLAISSKGLSHTTVPIVRTEHQVQTWYKSMVRDVFAMIDAWELLYWHKNLGQACVSYGRPCEFARLCNTPNPEAFIEGEYKVEFWNPLKKEEVAA